MPSWNDLYWGFWEHSYWWYIEEVLLWQTVKYWMSDGKVMLEQSHYEILRVLAFYSALCRVENWERGASVYRGFRESYIESFYFSLCMFALHMEDSYLLIPQTAEELLFAPCALNMYYGSILIPSQTNVRWYPVAFWFVFLWWIPLLSIFCILVHPYVLGNAPFSSFAHF